jgi:sugar lactone lactonase YvrE
MVIGVDPDTGARTTVAGGELVEPDGMARAPDGDILVTDLTAFGGGGGVFRVDPATGAVTAVSANGAPAGGPAFSDPVGVAVEADGDILVADDGGFGGAGGVIRVDPATGARTALSANGAPPGGPDFADPSGLAVEANGDILVADENAFGGTGGVIRVDPATGARTTVSANGAPPGGPVFSGPFGIALEADGDILVADYAAFGGGGGVIRVDPATGARTTLSANNAPPDGPDFQVPLGVAVEADGTIVVLDNGDQFGSPSGVIRVDPATGARTALSANGAPPAPAGGVDFGDPRAVAVVPRPPRQQPPPSGGPPSQQPPPSGGPPSEQPPPSGGPPPGQPPVSGPQAGACANAKTGSAGPDTLTGTPFGDALRGLAGNDVLLGLAGDDCLSGGAGNDRLSGGSGNDRVSGGRGGDRLLGGRGNDRINPGPGPDRIDAGPGKDRINVQDRAHDRIDCGPGQRDLAIIDRFDTTRNCEHVRRR